MSIGLRDQSGVRVPLIGGSLLIGRAPSCHIVVQHPQVSRQHVLVVELAGGAQIVPLGRRPVTLNGEVIDKPTTARAGDELAIEDARFTLEVLAGERCDTWAVDVSGTRYPIRSAGFRIGGGEDDDLRLPGWPVRAAVLFPHPSAVLAELHPKIELALAERDAGTMTALARGETLRFAGLTLTIALAQEAAATLDVYPSPSEVSLEFMPNGGLLRIISDSVVAIWLPQKRADLVAALLAPLGGARAGDWISDDAIIPRIWGAESASRVQLNTLIHRTRLSLTAAGLPGPRIIERSPVGGSTRFRLTTSTRVSVL